MKWPTWWPRRQPSVTLDDSQLARLHSLAQRPTSPAATLREQRWVIVDLETTGLNMQRDVVLSIGAVVIENDAIDFAQMFERTLARADHRVSPSVLLHGLAPSAIAAGSAPAEALLDFLEFVGDSPVCAFHAPFDRHMLNRALRESLALHETPNDWLDIADLAPLLCPDTQPRMAGLDSWTQHFQLHAQERHHASADALVSAELMLILLCYARRQGFENLHQLRERLSQWQRRQQAPSF